MSRRSTPKNESAGARLRWAAWLDTAALWVVLLVVGMRPLVSETYDSSLGAIGQVTQSIGDPTSATTAWLDLAILVAGLATAGAALLSRRRWRLTGIEIGAAILVAAATISTLVSSNKRLAINASVSWLTALALVVIVANLCRDRLRIGLLLAVLGASGLSSVTRCAMQKTVEFRETQQAYLENKVNFWTQQNVSPDDPRIELYERRLNAAEANGFFAMSNTEAAWLSLAGFAILGLRGLISRNRSTSAWLLILAALAFGTILFTGSKGGLIATAGGLLAWFILSRIQDRLRYRWFVLLIAAWVGLAGMVSALVTCGIVTGGLPTDSMRFRWNYWVVTRDIIEQHWATGVGALNFDNAYLLNKPAQFPEEIRDPHNFMLSIISQWGVLGGLGFLAVLIGGSYMAARTWGMREPTEAPPPIYDPQAKYEGLAWVVAVSIGYVLLRLMLMRGWLGSASGNAYVFFDLGLYGMAWIVSFTCLVWVARRSWTGDIDLCQLACLVAGLTFVVHNLIDCSMYYPGTLFPFAAMVGLLGASRPECENVVSQSARGRVVAFAVLAIGMILSAALIVVPTTRANSLLSQARFHAANANERETLLQRAVDADPLDPTAPAELAETLARTPGSDISKAIEAINEATWRDPERASLYRLKASILELSAQQSGSMAEMAAAIGVAGKAVSLYPNSPEDHVWLADMIVRNGVAAGSEQWANEAINNYQTALKLDDLRPAGEIRKWTPEYRKKIEQDIQEVAEQAASQPATAQEGEAIN